MNDFPGKGRLAAAFAAVYLIWGSTHAYVNPVVAVVLGWAAAAAPLPAGGS